ARLARCHQTDTETRQKTSRGRIGAGGRCRLHTAVEDQHTAIELLWVGPWCRMLARRDFRPQRGEWPAHERSEPLPHDQKGTEPTSMRYDESQQAAYQA